MRIRDAALLVLGPRAGAWALSLLGSTLRISRQEAAVAELWAVRAPAIYATWHSRVLLLPYLYRGRRLRVLVSRSRDGELLSRLIGRFGLQPVRGSSSRGGAEALRILTRSLGEGWGVVVVPDGPKGPPEVVKPGIVGLARSSGAPIVPLAVGASADWRVRSWDGFRIPRPFARCVVCFAEPIRVEREADRPALEAARKEVEAALAGVTSRADAEARA